MQTNCFSAVLKDEIWFTPIVRDVCSKSGGSQPETNHTFSVSGCFICEAALSAQSKTFFL